MSVLSLVGACLQILKSREEKKRKGKYERTEEMEYLFFFLYKVVIAVSLVCPSTTVQSLPVVYKLNALPENMTFQLRNLRPGQKYNVSIRAVNAAGPGEESTTKFITKDPEHSGTDILAFKFLFYVIGLVFPSIHPSSVTAYLAHRVSHLHMGFFSAIKYVIYLFIFVTGVIGLILFCPCCF